VFCKLVYRFLNWTQLFIRQAKQSCKNPSWRTIPKILVKTKLPTISTRSSKSGNDGSLLEIKEEELWVGSGYLSNDGETKGRSDLMSHKDV
jgi:hypothetical protein